VLFRSEAIEIKKEVTIPIILVGGIRTLQTAKDILDNGDADMISMCRPFIREPDLLLRWQKGDASPAKCISCSRCLRGGKPVACNEEIIATKENKY
jgi:2,4-dienoyl-CoA reductase-like NADH-dependent reductase (Old Yellow Enzyme family)